jgi:hypothetical protein
MINDVNDERFVLTYPSSAFMLMYSNKLKFIYTITLSSLINNKTNVSSI